MKDKTYLGDGVYIEEIKDCFVLTTEDGLSVHNKIYLESEVVVSLLKYLNTRGWKLK